jgi:hypothetical protein
MILRSFLVVMGIVWVWLTFEFRLGMGRELLSGAVDLIQGDTDGKMGTIAVAG